MYRENWETVLAMKTHTIVVSRNEIGMSGPALRAMIGNVNTTLIDGAMCVMPWNTTCGKPSTFRRRLVVVAVVAASAVISGPPLLRNRFRIIMSCIATESRAGITHIRGYS
jgi:hypothetical protein